MFNISDNYIVITRGDTGNVELQITQADGTEYQRANDDLVIFTVKRSTNDPQPLIQKIIAADNNFKIEPEDTENLEYGTYCYDVEVIMAEDASVNTIITPSPFIVAEEVTW